jgi:hypothetical protein
MEVNNTTTPTISGASNYVTNTTTSTRLSENQYLDRINFDTS